MFEFCLHVIALAGIFSLIALSLNLQAGTTGLMNFGQIAFVGFGAYAVGLGHQAGWSLSASILAGVFAAMALALVISRLGRNLAADYWGIATLAVAEIIRMVTMNEGDWTGGAQGLSALPSLVSFLPDGQQNLGFTALAIVLVAITACVSQRITYGRFGRALRLLREQPQLASCLGYNILSLKTRALLISAVIASIAGSMLACYTSYVSPNYLLPAQTFLVWCMVMIGGLGNIWGVVCGAILVQFVYSFVPFAKDYLDISTDVAGALRLGLIGVILLACLMWRSEGLFPERMKVMP
ncbi:branched-chain amino acid ABC transporter permease [Pseudomonas monteilii]|uniref:branched-chain amino acid ABC transporter permease n=1 Tax=Pseudomonas monteilii TaxID=76759 RepID=UPI003D08169B